MADKSPLQKLLQPSQSEVGLEAFFGSLPILLPVLLIPVIWYFRVTNIKGTIELCKLINVSCNASSLEIVHSITTDLFIVFLLYSIGTFALGFFLYTQAGGNFPQENQGKSTMVRSVVGVIVLYFVMTLVNFLAWYLFLQIGL